MAEGSSGAESASAQAGAPDVFISYASQDAGVAHETVEILESQGIRCWLAPRDVVAGSHYADAIIGAISGSRVFVLVLSDHAMASKHVGKEVERASSKGRPIIALRTSTAPLPPTFEYFLSESQWIDIAAGGVARAAPKLTEAVRAHLTPGATFAPQAHPATAGARVPNTGRRRNGMLAGGAAIFVLVLAYLGVARLRSTQPVVAKGAAAAPVAMGDRAAAAAEKSIAVLPFVDMSEKHDQEYFSDGLSEELIDRLAHVPGLKVIARTSAFAFKGKNEDARAIASKLGVSNVLEGSVRKAGNKLRIGAQLIRASDGTEVWSETYSRDLSDIFELQAEISTTVASALNAALNPSTAPAQRHTNGTADVEAYKLLLQGNYYFLRGNQGDDNRAVHAVQQAIQRDPHYALAWAKLARIYAWEPVSGEMVPTEAGLKSHEAVQRALTIDPGCAEAYFARGNVGRTVDGNWSAAKADFERAASLDPDGEVGDTARSNLLLLEGETSGDYSKFFAEMRRALERNPLNANGIATLAQVQQSAGQLAQAAASYRQLLELNPAYVTAHAQYAMTLLLMGKTAEALQEAKQEPDEANRLLALACIYWTIGRRAESDAALGTLEQKFKDRSRYLLAESRAWRGEADAAFRWLDLAYQQSKGSVEVLRTDPYFQHLRSDPRYPALLRKAGLSS